MYKQRSDAIKVPILMYHSISDKCTVRFQAFTVSPTVFAKQMAYLYQSDYTPITITHWINARSNSKVTLPKRPVILTFDDGFEDFFTNALPILRQYHFTATLYVSTAFVGGTSRWLRREGETTRPMLTWEQLREIQSSNIECGGHTHSHPQLDILPEHLALNEIAHCKQILEDHLEQPIMSFAYPFGYYTPAVQHLVRHAGYSSACAVKNTMCLETTDPFALTRLMVTTKMNVVSLAALLEGTNLSVAVAAYFYMRSLTWQVIRRSSVGMTSNFRRGR